MPSAFSIYQDVDLVVMAHWGVVTTRDSLEMIQAYKRAPQVRASHDYLVDFSMATRIDVDLAQLSLQFSRLAHLLPPRNRAARTAIYAPEDIAFGLARMYQSLTEGRLPSMVGVFRTREASMQFLGRDDDPRFHHIPPSA